jgi:hypothetical protein
MANGKFININYPQIYIYALASEYFSVNISGISKRLNKNKEYKGFIFITKTENNG